MQPETPQPTPPPAAPVPPAQPQPPVAPAPQHEGQAFYTPVTPTAFTPPAPVAVAAPHKNAGSISWEASEYVHIDKGAAWLVVFGLIVAAFLGVAIWLGAWTFAAVVLVMAVAMVIFAFRPPRVISYSLTEDGIKIGEQTFHYENFKSFGVIEDGAFFIMNLIPVKRFSPAINIYFAEDHGDQIVDIMGAHLPMQELHPDIFDNIMRRLRF